jgi:hypothetical protein
MFRTLARLLNDPTLTSPTATPSEQVFLIHPLQLSRWLEQAWTFAATATWLGLPNKPPYLGDPKIISSLRLPDAPVPLLNFNLSSGISTNAADYAPGVDPLAYYNPPTAGSIVAAGLPWDHLIYALLIENTGVYEILGEVLRRYAVGETLEAPSLETQRWLRTTEELFFRDPPLFHITGLTSHIRPDTRITRRNAYWRMFGMDCAHPMPPQYATPGADQVWKRDVGSANERFHEIFVQLLQQVWLGIENVTNSSGANPTDPSYIGQLSQILRDMFDMRRRGGQLAREEFVHVSTMSWFHLTVDSNTPLVIDLKAQGTDPADRLAKIGQRVGITPPRQAREYFEMAGPISTLLRFIELGTFDDATGAALLYKAASIRDDMNTVIDLWQSATGDPLKEVAVRVAAQPRSSAQPRFLPSSVGAASAPAARQGRTMVTTNGSRPS